MSVNRQDYEFKILDEGVSCEDLTPDKTHEKVTETLYQLLVNAEKAVTIGIEGSWGAGKSTVIELLKSKLSSCSEEKTLFFVFDAWAHEGDPLRRVFLESLISEIELTSKDQKLNDLLQEITSRKKTVVSRTTKKASMLGRLLFVTTLFIPIGASLLSQVDYDNLFWFFSERGHELYSLFVAGVLFSSAPFIVLLSWFFYWVSSKICGDGNVGWEFLESESKETFIQDITEENERSSIEFENYFTEIMKHIFSPSNKNKFNRGVIVIDNLDRITPEHATTIWSTLQTYFQHRNGSNQKSEWIKKLWFLVPFDREGLAKTIAGNNSPSSFTSSFIEKNLQLTIEVPPAVMSGWACHLKSVVDNALIGWPSNEKDKVIETIQKRLSNLEKSPTPRQINNLINQVGVHGIRWKGEVSPESIATYVVLRQKMTENQLRLYLLSIEHTNNVEELDLEESQKMELSGLLFGVPKKKGIELLLSPKIKTLLLSGCGKELLELILKYEHGFWIAWDSMYKNNIRLTYDHTEEYLLGMTKSICISMKANKDKVKDVVHDLKQHWIGKTRWAFANGDYAETLELLLDFYDGSYELISVINKSVQQEVLKCFSDPVKATPSNYFLKQILKVSRLVSKYGFDIEPISVTANVDIWTAWVLNTKEHDVRLPFILPKEEIVKNFNVLLNNTSNDVFNRYIPAALEAFVLLPESDSWTEVTESLIWLSAKAEEEKDVCSLYELMLTIYSKYKENESVNTTYQSAIKSQVFWGAATRNDLDDCIALPILTAHILGKELQGQNYVSSSVKTFWKQAVQPKFSELIISKLEAVEMIDVLWELARDPDNTLATDLIKIHANDELFFRYAPVLTYLSEYLDWIKNDESVNRIVYNLTKYLDLKDFRNKVQENILGSDEELFLFQLYGNYKAKQIVQSSLKKLSKEEWGDVFMNNSYILDCVIASKDVMNHKYSDAFENIFLHELTGKKLDDWVYDHFSDLFVKASNQLALTLKFTKKYFEAVDDELIDMQFAVFRHYFEQNLDKVDFEYLVTRIDLWIKNNQMERLDWFVECDFKAEKSESVNILESRINDLLAGDIDERYETIIRKISKIFGIKTSL